MPSDLLIRGATVVLPGVFPVEADVAIEGELIAADRARPEGAARRSTRAGCTCLPGVIDAHVHFNEPGPHRVGGLGDRHARARRRRRHRLHRDAAQRPPADDRRRRVRRQGRGGDRLLGGRLRALGRARAAATSTGSTSWPSAASSASRPSCATAGSRTSRPSTTRCSRPAWSARPPSGCPVAVHAERPSALREPAGTGWRDFVASRPIEAELEAIEVAIELAERHRLRPARRARQQRRGRRSSWRASDATCETCPHYLTLSEDDLETLGTRAKCAPPLRPRHEVRGALARGDGRPRPARRLRPLALPARA